MATIRGLLCVLICAGLFLPSQIDAGADPRRPSDFLALPTQDSGPRPLLNSLQDVTDLLPTYVGSANDRELLEWKAPCFKKNTAWLKFHNKSGSQFGGGTLHLKVTDAPWLSPCFDIYVFATAYRFVPDYYFKRGKKEFKFDEWKSEAEYDDVKRRGISILVFKSGIAKTVKALFEVLPMLDLDESGEEANVEFLKHHMGATFEERPKAAWVTQNINPDDIQSGDFLALSKFRGPSGLFEAFEKWATGAYAGHTAVCLRDPQGKLWVAESGVTKDDKEIIAIVPWEYWWEFERTKDNSNPHIGLLPLHSEVRKKFDQAAAWEFAISMNGSTYGFHNLIFSWIDTIADNYPPPINADLVGQFMNIFNQIKSEYVSKLWDEALNKRLGTEGLSLPEIMQEIEKRGLSFGEVLAIPERDDWEYTDGKSVSCVAFIAEIYKAAGIFGELATSIQGTEFTVKDGYILKIYEDDLSRLPPWCNEGDTVKLPFCQILGNYRLELPGYNTIEPYAHMNEKCPSLPTEYDRPQGC